MSYISNQCCLKTGPSICRPEICLPQLFYQCLSYVLLYVFLNQLNSARRQVLHGFPQSLRQMPRWYLKLDHRFCHILSNSCFPDHSTFQCLQSEVSLQYKPKGRRIIGRPRKRWRDQLHLEDQGSGNTPNPLGAWCWWWGCNNCFPLECDIGKLYITLCNMCSSEQKNIHNTPCAGSV